MPRMSGAKALVEALKAEKVKHIFGIPGGSTIPTYDVLYDERKIRHILTRHEQAAAHAAEGYARASGKVGVCLATSGPGATNLTTGILDAYMDSCPVVAITGQVPSPFLGTDAFQEADMMSLMLPITKHNFMARCVADLPRMIRLAFDIATTGRPGPVHIDIPKDVQMQKDNVKIPADVKCTKVIKFKPTTGETRQAVELLTKASRPVILAGGGIVSAAASAELVELAELLHAPVVTTMMGKGTIPENHPLSVGMLGMHGRISANMAITESDVLLGIGQRFDDRATGDVQHFAPKAKIIHVDIDPVEFGKNVRVDLPIAADAKLFLKDLIRGLRSKAKRGKGGQWIKRIEKLRKESIPRMDHDDVPIKPQRVIKEIMSVLGGDGIIVTEVGQNQMWAAHYYESRKPRHFIASGGLGTMGFGFPAALGAKVARPNADVVDIAGDGSFLMNSQELATAVDNNIPAVACILNNRCLGMVKQWQDMFQNKRRSCTSLGDTPDFVKLAEAYGAWGDVANRPSEIAPKLKEALKSGKPAVLEIVIDPDEHILPMVPPGGRLDKMLT